MRLKEWIPPYVKPSMEESRVLRKATDSQDRRSGGKVTPSII